jgi:DNA helicase-2/ATP-dependent DNA helicase PcrA
VKPGDVAVFYRTNAQSRALEEVFVRVGLPYKVVGGTRFYERKEVKDALGLSAGDLQPDRHGQPAPDPQRAQARGIGDRAEACVSPAGRARADPVRAALGRPEDAPGIATRSVAAIKAFTRLSWRACGPSSRAAREWPTCSRRSSSRGLLA